MTAIIYFSLSSTITYSHFLQYLQFHINSPIRAVNRAHPAPFRSRQNMGQGAKLAGKATSCN